MEDAGKVLNWNTYTLEGNWKAEGEFIDVEDTGKPLRETGNWKGVGVCKGVVELEEGMEES